MKRSTRLRTQQDGPMIGCPGRRQHLVEPLIELRRTNPEASTDL
jgi:hypothetical protein